MSDIVERLRDQGKDAFARHYSLGMFKLCTEAADEIERLQAALQEISELYSGGHGYRAKEIAKTALTRG